MPATIVARLWNAGRRACAFLLFVALPLTPQSPQRLEREQGRNITLIALETIDAPAKATTLARRLAETAHLLVWRTSTDGIRKISVSAPRAPGLWLRVTSEDDHHSAWRFVTLETGRSRNLLFGGSKPSGSFRLYYEFNGTAVRSGVLPVVFTFTEG